MSICSCSKAVYKPVWHIPLLSVQWINSWWWTDELSETCRVSWQNKFMKLVHLVGFITNWFVWILIVQLVRRIVGTKMDETSEQCVGNCCHEPQYGSYNFAQVVKSVMQYGLDVLQEWESCRVTVSKSVWRRPPVGSRRGVECDNKMDLTKMEIGWLWHRFVPSSWLLVVLRGLIL
jgi:hypothetical protein